MGERRQRSLFVPSLDRIDELHVLLEDPEEVAWIAPGPQLHQTHKPPQLIQELGYKLEARARRDRDVHFLVAVDEIVYLPSLSEAPLPSEERPEVIEIVVFHVLAGVAHRNSLEGLPNRE